MPKKIIGCLIFCLILSVGYAYKFVYADSTSAFTKQSKSNNSNSGGVPVSMVKQDAPEDYVVKKNDTVMKLAIMYLKKASYWPQFLGVKDIYATKIYPGDKLHILDLDGTRVLGVDSAYGRSSKSYEKLVPTVKDVSTEELPVISIKRLRNLILHPTLIDPAVFESLPMVVSGGDVGSSMYTVGDTIYVKGITGQQVGDQMSVYSKFRLITDPDTKESLGYEVRYDGDAIISQLGPISSLEISSMVGQIAPLDRVMALPGQSIPVIVPHKAQDIITGKIVALYDALTSTAEDNTVVINRGSRDGVEIGQVFDVTDTRKVIDPTSNPDKPQYLIMPPQVIGEVLIYKVYGKVSFGLITDSAKPIPLNAVVQSQQ